MKTEPLHPPDPPNRSRSSLALSLIVSVWGLGVLLGGGILLNHEFETAGFEPAPSVIPIPFESVVTKPTKAGQITLVVAVHPQCPCTRASIEQLDRLVTAHPEAFRVIALCRTEGDLEGGSWQVERSDYWERLSRLPNTEVRMDPDGEYANSVGALVSGAVVAYGSDGDLCFQGGLTASRGHAGTSKGMDRLSALAKGDSSENPTLTPAFGCPLNARSGS